ncbi:hypothetical protein F383_10797 [Gossypium arboreum]|uniref:Uncharacterized protein n=1 Tax=Gossypium arboreum TaxID=29729 RepID=A0A0B0NIF0_GOSAR|nr:hypothetical protein F383_10797 [Gossypium arboreum]
MCLDHVPFKVAIHACVPGRAMCQLGGILTCTTRPVTCPCVRPCGAY